MPTALFIPSLGRNALSGKVYGRFKVALRSQSFEVAHFGIGVAFDEMFQLSQLRNLNLCDNKLLRLPESIGQLRELVSLNLSMNMLVELPNAIGELDHLHRLQIQENTLQSIPPSIARLTSLDKLTMDQNKIKVIPLSLGALWKEGNPTLQMIRLTPEDYVEPPCNVVSRGAVEILRYLHTIQHATSSGSLALVDYDLQDYPKHMEQISHLTELNLSGNRIGYVHPRIHEEFYTSLVSVNLSNNRIETIDVEIGKLSALKQLLLHGNPIRAVPMSLGLIPNLSQFTIGEFPLV